MDEIVKAGEGPQAAVDLGDGIYMSRGIANTYLVTTAEGDVLVNAGLDFEAPEIEARFHEVSNGPLRAIVFTQGHPDHVYGWSTFDGPGVETIAQVNHTDVREYWRALPHELADRMGALYSIHAHLVGAMNRAGVPILAGTDCPNPYVYPGFSLHDELGLLVRAGLTPAEALRSATINPARFLGVTDSLGTVVPGSVADLVLLDANPLEDIANTKRIRAVIQGGRFLDRSALDQFLVRAKALAAADSN